MEDFLKEMTDILDEDTVNEGDRLDGFEAWDSLAILSVIVMAESRYHTVVSAQDIRGAATIADLYQLLAAGTTGRISA